MTTLDGAVELLDRALAYTRVALAAVSDADLDRPTPCAGWDLGRLLAHMEDSLDAYNEGAAGRVRLGSSVRAGARVRSLQEKACTLLGTWSGEPPTRTRIGEHDVDTAVLVLAAALEISVHGWDVARSLDLEHPLPEHLAVRLIPVATELVGPEDRRVRFGRALPAPTTAAPGARLLAFLGRDLTGPLVQVMRNPDTGPRAAS